MDITVADLLTVGLLVGLEGLLSADNALVMAIMVLGLPRTRHKQALRYGLVGGFAFRIVATLLAEGQRDEAAAQLEQMRRHAPQHPYTKLLDAQLAFARAATVSDHPAFADALAERIRERLSQDALEERALAGS